MNMPASAVPDSVIGCGRRYYVDFIAHEQSDSRTYYAGIQHTVLRIAMHFYADRELLEYSANLMTFVWFVISFRDSKFKPLTPLIA